MVMAGLAAIAARALATGSPTRQRSSPVAFSKAARLSGLAPEME